MTKLAEVMGELERDLDKHRVWTEARNFLRRFSDDEISNREKLKKDDGTEVDTDAVAEVIQEITAEKLDPILKRIEEIRNLEIGNGKKKGDTKKVPKGSTAEKGNGPEGGEGGVEGQGSSESQGASEGGRRLRRKKNPGRSLGRKRGQPAAGQ